MRAILLLLAACTGCLAQRWQLGGTLGYGLYHGGAVIAPAGKAEAGVRNRFAAGFLASEDVHPYISGEIRYLYQDGDPFLEFGGKKSNIQGQSHAFHYDVVVHSRPSGARLRPYVSIGGGAKLYVVSGPAPRPQPFAAIATLTTNDQAKVLVTAGLGLKYAWRDHVALRVELRDYITTFPRRLIAPAESATARGIFHQFTPMLGVAWMF